MTSLMYSTVQYSNVKHVHTRTVQQIGLKIMNLHEAIQRGATGLDDGESACFSAFMLTVNKVL